MIIVSKRDRVLAERCYRALWHVTSPESQRIILAEWLSLARGEGIAQGREDFGTEVEQIIGNAAWGTLTKRRPRIPRHKRN